MLTEMYVFIVWKTPHTNFPTSNLKIQNMSRDTECRMSVALLESSALQSIILQPLVNMLHDSSEMIFSVHGDPGSLTLQTCVDTNGSYVSYSGRQIQDDNQPKGNSSEVPYKICCTSPPPKKNSTTSLLSYIFGILQGNKSKHILYR